MMANKKKIVDVCAIVLAAGKGTRMKSDLPKVFHDVCGKPMLSYVLSAIRRLGAGEIYVVVGHRQELIRKYYKDWGIGFIVQEEQLGTAHAVMQAEKHLAGCNGTVLVVAGDMPLIKSETLKKMVEFHLKSKSKGTVLTARISEPADFGRIIRNKKNKLVKIVEKKDASLKELKINEINTGVYCFDAKHLLLALQQIRPENAQKEYYLTDVIEIFSKKRLPVFAYLMENPEEAIGINTKEELGLVEQLVSSRKAD
jgi:bifunctional UDP-N-acetylglucosamine pyrophosphorylase / glucosamine-1-phosphate N-acetyltransferase